MRALAGLVLLTTGVMGSAQAAEPGMWHFTLPLNGVSQQDCIQRGRDAMTAQNVRLAEATANTQYGVRGDYLALVVCTASQPTIMFVAVAGPEGSQARQLGQSIHDAAATPTGTSRITK